MNDSSKINSNDNIKLNYDFDLVKRIPLYFGTKEKPLLAWLHITNSKQHSSTGVVICPPLAVEYMNSYRSLRYTADYFALAGIPALRFDYHGTGDSSGIEEDQDRLDEWLSSIHLAMDKLKELTKCDKVGLFGFRMGATLAALVAEKTPIEFLISWAALNNGKKYIREIKLIQMTGKIQSEDNSLLEAGGMGYWEQTANDISNINLKNITPLAKRILIIPRDEQTNDTELYDVWATKDINDKDIQIEQQYHIGSTLMLVDAHLSVVPHKAIKNIIEWVQSGDANELINSLHPKNINNSISTNIPFRSRFTKDSSLKNSIIKESIFHFGLNNRNIAILTESERSKTTEFPTVIISNSGANHRVGPSRIYVLLARELSLMGYRCLRIDIPGIGDSIISDRSLENIEYINNSSDKLIDAIKKLDGNGQNNEYILLGLCSGAFFSFHAAIELSNINIKESILINPLTFYWEDGITAENSPTKNFSIWNWYKQAFTSKKSWIKLFKGKIDFKSLVMAIRDRIEIKYISKIKHNKFKNSTMVHINKHRAKLSTDLIKISENGCHLQFVFSRSDPGLDILMTNAARTVKKLQKKHQLGISFIENADHTFSKYKPRKEMINTLLEHFEKNMP